MAANQTVTVLEADGVTSTDVEILGTGRQAAAASKSTNFSTEDKAVVDDIAASLVTIDGRVDGLETLITSTNTKLDTAITALQIIDNMVLAAGTANIGDVDVLTLPALAAGSALIGKVDVQFAGTVPDTGSGTAGSKTQRVIIDSSQFSALGATIKTASVSVARATDETLGLTVTQAASSTITRPGDTTAYASGDLVANSTASGSVNNLQFTTLARISGGSGVIVGAQIQKSTNGVTNAAFRLHLFNTAPTYTSAGDNSAMTTVVVASAKGYLGYIDISAMVGFSDVAWGSGAPDNSRGGIPFVATAQIVYGILEARGAYTPGSAEVFTITLDALQD
jgi:hypothetical protein